MAKAILGVDIGNDSLKLALVKGTKVKKTAIAPMPKGLIRDGRVVSPQSLSELIRKTMKANKIKAQRAALILSNEVVFIRNVTMPWMNAEQLAYNLPFEFRDYISDELKNYVCDYAMISTPEELQAQLEAEDEQDSGEETDNSNASESGRKMELTAIAVPNTVMEESRALIRMSKLKMMKTAPTISAYTGLIRALKKNKVSLPEEMCILDLGYQSIRMYIFKGDCHEVTRVLETGLSSLDSVIADAYNVDIHLAHTYLLTNYEDCQNKEFCSNAYGNIAVELMRALNFFRFSNPDTNLSDVWLCGGGASIKPLKNTIMETLDLQIHDAPELVQRGDSIENCSSLIQAIGITMD